MFNKLKEYFKNNKNRRNLLWLLFYLLLIGTFVFVNLQDKKDIKKQSITQFMNFIQTDQAKNVKKVKIIEENSSLEYTYKKQTYTVKYPKMYVSENPKLIDQLAKQEIKVEFGKSMTKIFQYVLEILRIGIFIIIFYFVLKMFGDSFGGFDLKEVKNEKITFDDIGGYDEVKEELQEIIDFLKNPKEFEKYTDKIPKGVLFEGPPGNGKTLFAKAMAAEADVPFYQISGSDIEDKYVGSGARRVEKIFKTVREKADEIKKPVILFIDEIDAVGGKREARTVVETNQTINKMLTEMDGFQKDTKVIIIAATNLSSSLDEALTRSGRFDRIISINQPNLQERESVIELYLKKKGELIDEEVYREQYAYVLAQQTEGFSNADLDKLINESSLIARKKKIDKIDIKTLREAFTKLVAGVKTNRKVSEEEHRIAAYHEAGHATVQLLTSPKGYKGVAYITVTPHGQSLGHVSPVSDERLLLKRSEVKNQMKVMLGGRAVEEIILNGDYTTGALSDLKQVNRLLWLYVVKYGMGTNSENLFMENVDESNAFVQKEIKSERELLYIETKTLIQKHFDIVEKIAQYLLENPSIEQHELPDILKGTSYEDYFSLEDKAADFVETIDVEKK